MTVEISETLEKLTLEQQPPVNVLTLDLTEEKAIKATLEFEYDGARVPYGKLANKTPYVTVKKPEEEVIYWVKRNLKQEQEAYKILMNMNFSPLQTNNLLVEGDDAIDFYNNKLVRELWKIEETETSQSSRLYLNRYRFMQR